MVTRIDAPRVQRIAKLSLVATAEEIQLIQDGRNAEAFGLSSPILCNRIGSL
jgi:hypothetical protein